MTTIKIVYQTIDGKWHEIEVNQAEAATELERLRGLADVKTETVRTSM